MADQLFKDAFPFQQNVLTLPVEDLDQASAWYGEHFGLTEVERREDPPSVIMSREGATIGFAITGADATQDGAAVLINDAEKVKEDLESRGVSIGNWRIDERDDGRYQVFFVVAPDGLCFYFHQPLPDGSG
ncbi:MAG: VOC family protein [Pseudomonadota bacterium]